MWRKSNNCEPVNRYEYKAWKTLHRLRAVVTRTKKNKIKWKKENNDILCEYGNVQDEKYLLECPMINIKYE